MSVIQRIFSNKGGIVGVGSGAIQPPNSEVRVAGAAAGAAGYGSTNTGVRVFSTVLINSSPAILYAASATLGSTFTITEDGTYGLTGVDDGTNAYIGFTLNATGADLNTHVGALAIEKVAIAKFMSSGLNESVTTIMRLKAGDVLRWQPSVACNATAAFFINARIIQVSRG